MIPRAQSITVTFSLKFSHIAVKIIAHCLDTLADLLADSFIERAQLSPRFFTEEEFVAHSGRQTFGKLSASSVIPPISRCRSRAGRCRCRRTCRPGSR